MPRFSIWSIRIGLTYLALGFTFGALMLINKGVPISGVLWALLPLHIEFLLLAWTLHLVFGMAFWILPRFRQPPKRGNETIAWIAIILLNLGVWLAGIGPLLSGLAWMVIAGRLAEALSAAAFAIHAWPRVKATYG